MAQVKLQAGPYQVVSLISREAADELALVPGMLAVAAVKATNVVIERRRRPEVRRGSGRLLALLGWACSPGAAAAPRRRPRRPRPRLTRSAVR